VSPTEPHPPTVAIDPDLSGRRLGDYHLLRRLGRGGMADVYLAEQASLHRRVAFKVLKGTLAGNEAYVRRFLHEAQAAAALVHANIVQIHEVGCIEGIHFIAQEYVEGQNLRQLLQRHGALDATTTVHVLRHVAAALQKASQQKITHRDIKPENIMLSSAGEVKVADFGLARVDREGQSVDLTQIGVTMGTPLYMSPEQVEGRAVDTRSDLYSLGVTGFHMLAGRPPFEGDLPLNIAVQHLRTPPPRLEDLRPDLPAGLHRIIHKLMAKAPPDRYQTAAELLVDLRGLPVEGLEDGWPSALETREDTGSETSGHVEATRQLDAVLQREATLLRRPRHTAVLIAAAALALLLGGALAWTTRPKPLLQVAEQDLRVARQATVRDQYLRAVEVGTEQGWQSVEKHFPPEKSELNRYYALRAKQHLAELYVQNGDLDRAQQCYSELENAQDNPELQAIGLAGQANVHILRGESSQATQRLLTLVRILDQLPAAKREPLRRLLDAELNPRLRPHWQQLFRDSQPPRP
jgi:serine/threonine-protein kinase